MTGINNEKLEKEIKSFVENKIKDVKSVDDINLNNFSDSKTIDIINLEESYRHLLRLKKILQLIINIFNDFDGYKDFVVKLVVDDNDSSIQWHSYYQLDNNSSVWRCIKMPSKEFVIELLSEYVLYFMSIKKKDSQKKHIDDCPFCDNPLSDGVDKCGMCDASIDEMSHTNNKKDKYEQEPSPKKDSKVPNNNYVCEEKKTDADNSVKGTTENSVVSDGYDNRGSCNAWRDNQMYPKGSFKDDNRAASPENMNCRTNENYEEDKPPCSFSDKGENPPKVVYGIWICGGCGFHNDYLSSNCTVCTEVFKIGKWYCEQCTMENSCANDVCDVCGERNVYEKTDADNTVKGRMEDSFVSLNMDDKSRQDGPELSDDPKSEQWYCEQCKLWHVFRVAECSSCHNNRIKCGKWQCQKCTMLNIFSVTICAACNDPINYFEVKKDKSQKKKKGDSKNKPLLEKNNPNKWQCRYQNCKSINPNNDEYCSQCKIYRHFSCKVGEEVKKMTKGMIVSGWICWKCTKFNDLAGVKCAGSGCSKKRYERIICNNCSETSDTITENCLKCGNQFR